MLEADGLDFVDVCEAQEHAIQELTGKIRSIQDKAIEALSSQLVTTAFSRRFDLAFNWQKATEAELIGWGLPCDTAHAIARSIARAAYGAGR
jgi:hypothetical protein